MNRKWLLLLAALLLGGVIAGEWMADTYARQMEKERRALSDRLEDLRVRTLNAEKEEATYVELSKMADELRSTIRWEPDSTNILRWFADMAARLNLRLMNSKRLGLTRGKDAMVLGVFHKTRYSLQMEGAYDALVKCLEQLERSPHVMLIESITMAANREDDGTGQMKVTLTCLHPQTAAALPETEKDSAE